MKGFVLLMSLFFFGFNALAQFVPKGDTLYRISDSVAGYNGINIGYVNSIKVVAEWRNGMLDGQYVSYYENGNVRAKGHYTANRRTGKWKVYDETGKNLIIINFNRFGTTSIRRVKSGGLSHVRFGKGTIHYHQPSMIVAGDTIIGEVNIRHGLKHGAQTERYRSGSLYAVAEYKNGLYYGPRRLYFPATKPAAEMEYNDEGPTGMWKFFDEDGGLKSMRDFNDQSEYSAQRLFIGDFDLLWAQRCIIYIDSSFFPSSLSYASNDTTLFSFANKLFVDAEINAYADPLLSKEHFPTHDNQQLLPTSIINGKLFPKGWMLMVDYFYNIQTTLMYHSIISLCPIAMNADSNKTNYGPWLYFPELRDKAVRSNNNEMSKLLKLLKTGGFQYLLLANENRNGLTLINEIGLNNNYRIPEQEHTLWLQSYGVNNPVCR